MTGNKITIDTSAIHTIRNHHFYDADLIELINFFEILPNKNYNDVEIVCTKYWDMKMIEPINNNVNTFNTFVENGKRFDVDNFCETPYVTQTIENNIIYYNNNHLYICCQDINSMILLDNIISIDSIKLNENNINRCYVKYDLRELITLTENELIKENTKK